MKLRFMHYTFYVLETTRQTRSTEEVNSQKCRWKEEIWRKLEWMAGNRREHMKWKIPVQKKKRRDCSNCHSQRVRISDLKQKNFTENTRTEQTDVITDLSPLPNAINCGLEATSWGNATSRPSSTNRIPTVTHAKEHSFGSIIYALSRPGGYKTTNCYGALNYTKHTDD
jgi:hypothetical protein